ncbi:hypothetical protein CDD80_951 [Ophiocordyceps camponoti-rufipedis]|uniref:Uncharacterized protein n=1 Tax=Ophiocordyceps camponoti-rufipedis TaxID=2004952 RepID=A0A2C5ZBJ3_9HYPO|nr:hypothetical protein CDD80_951 [Ophiocordyceps camponoti-rufipedis]
MLSGKQPQILPNMTVHCSRNNLELQLRHVESGITYLEAMDSNKACYVNIWENGCSRISCSWNHAIFLCLRGLYKYLPCHEAAHLARVIMDQCVQTSDHRVAKLRRTTFKGGSVKWDSIYGATVSIRRQTC